MSVESERCRRFRSIRGRGRSTGRRVPAGAVTVFRGGLIVGVASLLGAVTQGGSVANTIGNDLVHGVAIDARLAAVILLTASAVIIIISTLKDIPMPSAFLLVGGTIGAGLAAGGSVGISTAKVIVGFWIAIPFLAVGIGYTSARLFRRFLSKDETSRRYINVILILLGIYTAYTAGANRAGLPAGPLLNVLDVQVLYLLLFAGFGMLAGAWTSSPRIIRAVSKNYSRLGPRRAIGALLSASLIAQAATFAGVPISFNQTVIFSVIGSGLVEGGEGVGTEMVLRTVGAWLLALVVSSAITYGITTAVIAL